MKKISGWIFAVSAVLFMMDWGIIGLEILDGEYDLTAKLYVALALWAVMTVSVILFRFVFAKKCPNCGKRINSEGKFCPHCGKERNL